MQPTLWLRKLICSCTSQKKEKAIKSLITIKMKFIKSSTHDESSIDYWRHSLNGVSPFLKKRMEKFTLEILDNQTYENIVFDDINIFEMVISGSKFKSCSFINANFQDVITRKCAFAECNFKSAQLNGSKHEATAFTNCQFSYANFFSAQFDQCKMLGSSFIDVNMIGITINNGDWSYTNLRLNNLKGQDLRKTRFAHADFYRCNLEKVNFREADLSFSIFTQANLSGADLRDANVDGVDFKSFNLKGVKLDIAQTICVARSFGAIIE